MQVINSVDQTQDVLESRLAAEMLCLEHGARVYNPDLTIAPKPHALWPSITINPTTDRGLPYTIQYKPCVGVVYYSERDQFRVSQFINRIIRLLDDAGDDHLTSHRTIGATPSTIIWRKGGVSSGYHYAGNSTCPVNYLDDETQSVVARYFLYTTKSDFARPPHYSTRGAFTWVFKHIASAVHMGRIKRYTIRTINATVAGIVYDAANITNLADGSSVDRLKHDHFKSFTRPNFIKIFRSADGGTITNDIGHISTINEYNTTALMIDINANLKLLGNYKLTPTDPPKPQIDEEKWDPTTIVYKEEGSPACMGTTSDRGFTCLTCAVPLGGDAIVLRNVSTPKYFHVDYCNHDGGIARTRAQYSPLGGDLIGGYLMCVPCWNSMDDSCTKHLDMVATRTVIPFSQGDACISCPGYSALGPILNGRATFISEDPKIGAVLVDTPCGSQVILAAQSLGYYPDILHAYIARLGTYTIAQVRLFREVR